MMTRTWLKSFLQTVAIGFFALVTSSAFCQARQPGEVFRECDLCPEMVALPIDSFEMRTPPWGPGRPHNEGFFYAVTFAQAFSVGKFEITFDEWESCVNDGMCQPLDDSGWGKGRRPAINMTWSEAVQFTHWLSAKTGKQYRLPTNAEWEYAARAGLGMNRYFGIAQKDICKYGNVYDLGAHKEFEFDWKPEPCTDGKIETAEVGSFLPNAYGVYDSIGNVFEWTEDCASPRWRGAPGNGKPWIEGDCSLRGYRGASWITNEPYYLLEPHRFKYFGARANDLGFRVVRDMP